jgi:hypothetical protein
MKGLARRFIEQLRALMAYEPYASIAIDKSKFVNEVVSCQYWWLLRHDIIVFMTYRKTTEAACNPKPGEPASTATHDIGEYEQLMRRVRRLGFEEIAFSCMKAFLTFVPVRLIYHFTPVVFLGLSTRGRHYPSDWQILGTHPRFAFKLPVQLVALLDNPICELLVTCRLLYYPNYVKTERWFIFVCQVCMLATVMAVWGDSFNW